MQGLLTADSKPQHQKVLIEIPGFAATYFMTWGTMLSSLSFPFCTLGIVDNSSSDMLGL
jgi:hypothetical protein